jgi:hypothetical protein
MQALTPQRIDSRDSELNNSALQNSGQVYHYETPLQKSLRNDSMSEEEEKLEVII